MIHFLLLMFFPLLISATALVLFKRYDIWTDFLIQIGIVAVLMVGGLAISYVSRTSDTQLLDGQVTGKERLKVSCEHSYQCNCHMVSSGSGKNKTTTEECDTCYEHAYDIDWRVDSSIGDFVNIDRIDRQGLDMPKRWADAYVGEPYVQQTHYTNYILANPDSVLLGQKGDLQKFGSMIPVYPEVYDYYKVNHVLNMGVPNVNNDTWNWLVSQANRQLGPSKQLNVLIVLVPTADPSYAYAFRDKWVGGKKNDAIILIGSLDGHKIEWADVISWTTNKGYIIKLRDAITGIGVLDKRDEIVQAIVTESNTDFVRMHMKNYEWLLRNFEPSATAMWILFIIGMLASLGATWFTIIRARDDGGYSDDEDVSRVRRFKRSNRYGY